MTGQAEAVCHAAQSGDCISEAFIYLEPYAPGNLIRKCHPLAKYRLLQRIATILLTN